VPPSTYYAFDETVSKLLSSSKPNIQPKTMRSTARPKKKGESKNSPNHPPNASSLVPGLSGVNVNCKPVSFTKNPDTEELEYPPPAFTRTGCQAA
jgi:hypothetical protein